MSRPSILLVACAAACSAGRAAPSTSTASSDPSGGGLRFPEFGPVPPPPVFAGDPTTAAKVTLGRDLYYDVRLSGSGHVSCNSCHVRATNFQDGLDLSSPDRSYPSDSPTDARNTPSLLNLEYAPVFRWDGSSTDLVAVLALPFAEANLNVEQLPPGSDVTDVPGSQAALHAKVTGELAGYVPLYQRAFGVDVRALGAAATWELTGRALRAFLSPAVARAAPFDRWNAGEDAAMSASAQHGFDVFRGAGRCAACHYGALFTDFSFHNLSTSPPGPDGARADEGRYLVTNDTADQGAFLTPSLRQAYVTSPYFHNGSQPALRDVFAFFCSPAVMLDPLHDRVFDTPLTLSDDDMTGLSDFIEALRSGPVAGMDAPAPGDLP